MSFTSIPPFLLTSLGAWLFMFLFFIGFSVYLHRLPDDEILRQNAKAIENKRRLGIRIYRF